MDVIVDEHDWLARRFEETRNHLRAVAYRMLGSLSEADDAVQETWLRLSRSDTREVENLRGWLTTVVARVSLDMLRSRKTRSEEPLDLRTTEPIASSGEGMNPEEEAAMAESVGLALLVVLDMLTPAERLALVLHDMFAVPFDEIAPMVGRSPDAARQLASRARRRVQGAPKGSEADLSQQRQIVDAFLAALRAGDFEGLLAVLDPEVVVRLDTPTADGRREIRGAEAWAKGALSYSRAARFVQPALVNGAVGAVFAPRGRLLRALSFTIKGGKIAEVEVIADPARVHQLDLAALTL
jgi:RNA polymerase sigma-70 factor (ECF subfamily)